MKIVHSIQEIPLNSKPGVLTIGKFDGLHLGHQSLLNCLTSKAREHDGKSYVITFQNHPSKIISPDFQVLDLITQAHKIKLLRELNVDVLILLPFTAELSQQTAEQFLSSFYAVQPFSELILGHDAVLGKARHGDRSVLGEVSEKLNFKVDYIPAIHFEGASISSSLIRQKLQQGNFSAVQELLGRPYSIYSEVISGKGQGRGIGFPTANLEVNGLCLPPFGVYAVAARFDGKEEKGVANVGFAPTVRNDRVPLLEVHLPNHKGDFYGDLYGKNIEVIFQRFIRSEIKFNNIDELKVQIAKDVSQSQSAT